MTRRLLNLLVMALVAFVAAVLGPTASAHVNRPHMEEEPEERPTPPPGEELEGTVLSLQAPARAELGGRVEIRASLHGAEDGDPIEHARIVFETEVAWSEAYAGEAVIGTASTDHQGIAVLVIEARRAGPVSYAAHFEGDGEHAATEASTTMRVMGDRQLYTPSVGVRVPGLGPWTVMALIALLWGLYLLVSVKLSAIARGGSSTAGEPGRRRFLTRALPAGVFMGIAALGGGLVALVARSPRTHDNLRGAPHALGDYARTPPAWVGGHGGMSAMPAVLDRKVSFSYEVHPILLAKGGPHAVVPENQPPPAGIRLDSYEAIMEMEELVVPGKPEDSELVSVLLDPAMKMPPSGLDLSSEEVQLIVSWVAQGAKNN